MPFDQAIEERRKAYDDLVARGKAAAQAAREILGEYMEPSQKAAKAKRRAPEKKDPEVAPSASPTPSSASLWSPKLSPVPASTSVARIEPDTDRSIVTKSGINIESRRKPGAIFENPGGYVICNAPSITETGQPEEIGRIVPGPAGQEAWNKTNTGYRMVGVFPDAASALAVIGQSNSKNGSKRPAVNRRKR